MIRKDLHDTNISYSPSKDGNVRWCKYLKEGKHKLAFSLLSTPELLIYLKIKLKYAATTIQSCMSFTIWIINVKLRRDIIAQFHDKYSGVVTCACDDGQSVLLVSKFDVTRPYCDEVFNNYKGDTNKTEMYLSLNRSKFKNRKCYHGIVIHLTAFKHCKCFYHLKRKRRKCYTGWFYNWYLSLSLYVSCHGR